ncbi:MAG: glycosyltransferase [Candidatus Diapherotrites archaeon]
MVVSFIIPAHNEEKMIGFALEPLIKLKADCPFIEILVGLDGCTDRTKEVAGEFKEIKLFEFKERKGKHKVLNELVKKARGEICVINDADWIFVARKNDLKKMIECFEDKSIGGLGDHYALTFAPEILKKSNSILFAGEAWNLLFITEYKNKFFTKEINGERFADFGKASYPFFVHFFRKNSVGEATTLADDAERFLQIERKGLKVKLLPFGSKPYFIPAYNSIDLKGILKQRSRGFIAQKQIREKYGSNNFTAKTSLSLFFYALKNLPRVKKPKHVFGVLLWWVLSGISYINYAVRKRNLSTEEGWQLGLSR